MANLNPRRDARGMHHERDRRRRSSDEEDRGRRPSVARSDSYRDDIEDQDFDYEERTERGDSGRGYGGYSARRGRAGGEYGREHGSNYGRAFAFDYDRGYGRSYGEGYAAHPDEPGGAYGRESVSGRRWRGYRPGYGPGDAYRGGPETPSPDYRGLGPRGYTRSDERIREDVCDWLCDDPLVDASDVEVSVAKSEVTLSGTVASREQKRRAEDCAERVSGIMHVQNNIRVTPGQGRRTG